MAFVEQLYAAGAVRVFVPQDSIVADAEELEMGGPYSDHLIVEFAGPEVPRALASLYRAEANIEGWQRTDPWLPIIHGCFLLLWWD